jgi:hypothetical protein
MNLNKHGGPIKSNIISFTSNGMDKLIYVVLETEKLDSKTGEKWEGGF